jgi:hypothetical protein
MTYCHFTVIVITLWKAIPRLLGWSRYSLLQGIKYGSAGQGPETPYKFNPICYAFRPTVHPLAHSSPASGIWNLES